MNCCIVVSIHLMLLFINASAIPLPTVSSVSIHLMLLFIYGRPDTSVYSDHVSIHLMLLFIGWLQEEFEKRGWFQYISCYSLSTYHTRYNKYPNRFQYISCYSLSTSWDLIRFSYCRFNTSHVTLYQRRVEEFIPVVLRFNTSHVTLYLNIGKPRV